MPSFTITGPGNVTAGNNAVFTVTMSVSISSSYTIWYSTLAGTASAADGDYSGSYVNQPLTFTPGGSTMQQIVIPNHELHAGGWSNKPKPEQSGLCQRQF